MTELIDGKAVAAAVRARVAERVKAVVAGGGAPPGLATVLVGEDAASRVYVAGKHRACAEVGMASFDVVLEGDATQDALHRRIDELVEDDRVHGMIVQLPLPAHLDSLAALDRIPAAKDADGLTTVSQGLLATGRPGLRPATPSGVIELLDASGVELRGASVVVVGRSILVGRPVAALLLERDATVTVCHSRTRDLAAVTRAADVLVAAVGRPRMLGRDHVGPGAVVIDVGINRTDDGLVGDVDAEAVTGIARLLTPVPGGVGPMTIAMLLQNTVTAAEQRAVPAAAGTAS
jgi:methylenetetrahydrofolate dehydrogenase (NADP+)/methenyltetrahydrofolate cyclohydrolase